MWPSRQCRKFAFIGRSHGRQAVRRQLKLELVGDHISGLPHEFPEAVAVAAAIVAVAVSTIGRCFIVGYPTAALRVRTRQL